MNIFTVGLLVIMLLNLFYSEIETASTLVTKVASNELLDPDNLDLEFRMFHKRKNKKENKKKKKKLIAKVLKKLLENLDDDDSSEEFQSSTRRPKPTEPDISHSTTKQITTKSSIATTTPIPTTIQQPTEKNIISEETTGAKDNDHSYETESHKDKGSTEIVNQRSNELDNNSKQHDVDDPKNSVDNEYTTKNIIRTDNSSIEILDGNITENDISLTHSSEASESATILYQSSEMNQTPDNNSESQDLDQQDTTERNDTLNYPSSEMKDDKSNLAADIQDDSSVTSVIIDESVTIHPEIINDSTDSNETSHPSYSTSHEHNLDTTQKSHSIDYTISVNLHDIVTTSKPIHDTTTDVNNLNKVSTATILDISSSEKLNIFETTESSLTFNDGNPTNQELDEQTTTQKTTSIITDYPITFELDSATEPLPDTKVDSNKINKTDSDISDVSLSEESKIVNVTRSNGTHEDIDIISQESNLDHLDTTQNSYSKDYTISVNLDDIITTSKSIHVTTTDVNKLNEISTITTLDISSTEELNIVETTESSLTFNDGNPTNQELDEQTTTQKTTSKITDYSITIELDSATESITNTEVDPNKINRTSSEEASDVSLLEESKILNVTRSNENHGDIYSTSQDLIKPVTTQNTVVTENPTTRLENLNITISLAPDADKLTTQVNKSEVNSTNIENLLIDATISPYFNDSSRDNLENTFETSKEHISILEESDKSNESYENNFETTRLIVTTTENPVTEETVVNEANESKSTDVAFVVTKNNTESLEIIEPVHSEKTNPDDSINRTIETITSNRTLDAFKTFWNLAKYKILILAVQEPANKPVIPKNINQLWFMLMIMSPTQ